MRTYVVTITTVIVLILFLILLTMLQAERFQSFTTIIEYRNGLQKSSRIPNILWTYWHDDQLPPIIEYCISTWRKFNPTYDIRVVNASNIHRYVRNFSLKKFVHAVDGDGNITSFARYSDYVRLNVVPVYGGLWLDASTMCQAPFDWVHGIQQTQHVDFIAYRLDGFASKKMIHPTPVIESWFFACVPMCPFALAWRDEFMRMSHYKSVYEYLVSLEDVDFSGIAYPDYLAIHVANQVVMQRQPQFLHTMYTLSAEKGPFQYLVDNNWNPYDGVMSFVRTTKYRNNPYIKMRSCERPVFEEVLAEYIENQS